VVGNINKFCEEINLHEEKIFQTLNEKGEKE